MNIPIPNVNKPTNTHAAKIQTSESIDPLSAG
jgi:hypothetical protein